MSLKQLMSVPLKQLVFRRRSLPVLLGLSAVAAFLLFSGAEDSVAQAQTAVNVSVVAIYKALGGVGQPLKDSAPMKVARMP